MRYHAGHIRVCFYSGVLLLVLSLPKLFSQSRLDSVMDAAVEAGKMIYQAARSIKPGDVINIRLHQPKPGIYILKVSGNALIINRKLVIE